MSLEQYFRGRLHANLLPCGGMLSNGLSISAFDEIQILVLLSLFFGVIFLASDTRLRSLIEQHWKSLVLVIILCLVWRTPSCALPFYGLEYEDSYVYTVSALSPTAEGQYEDSHFLTHTCVVGSLDSCEKRETFSGHYIGWPAILRIASRFFHHPSTLPIYVNLVASCVSVVSIYLLCSLILTKEVAWCSSLLYAITPAFAVHGMAAYSEPISNTCISVAALWYVRLLYKPHDAKLCEVMNWCVLLLTLVLLIVIKRENILFLIMFPLLSLLGWYTRIYPSPTTKRMAITSLCCAAAIAWSIGGLRVFESLMRESQEFGHFPFSIMNALRLIPSFLRCIAAPEWYGFTALLVLIGIINACRTKSFLCLIVGMLLSYGTVYLSHLHGYYQIHGVAVAPEGHLRFLMNCMTWWSILAGAGIASIFQYVSYRLPKGRGLAIALCCIYAVTCGVMTANLRERARDDEVGSRIVPALDANAIARASEKPVYVVTLEPLIIQMFGSASTRIIGLYAVNNDLLKRICTSDTRTELLVLKQAQYDEETSVARYALNWASLDRLKHSTVYSSPSFSLIKESCPE